MRSKLTDNKRSGTEAEPRSGDMLATWQRELFEKTLRVIAIVALPVVLVGGYYTYVTRHAGLIPLILAAYGIVLLGAFVPRLPYTWRVWFFLGVVFALGFSDLWTYGWGEDARIYFLGATLFATVFLRGLHGLVALILSCILLAVFVGVVMMGFPTPVDYQINTYTTPSLLSGFITFCVFAIALYASFSYLFPRVLSALRHSDTFSLQSEQGQSVLAGRTQALQIANANLQRRALYLASSTHVFQSLATVFELDALLEQAVNLISRTFEFSHVGIFLMDEKHTTATLKAASSAGGRRLVAQGYSVTASDDSLVGQVLVSDEACVNARELASGEVAVAEQGIPPDGPHSQAEVALPLHVAARLSGVLHIQSAEVATFDKDDVRTLQGLAGLLAVAIDNARRLGDEAAVLEAASPLYRLANRLATVRTEQQVYATMLGVLQGFNPARAFLFRTHSVVDETLYLVAEMRSGELNFHAPPLSAEALSHIGPLANFGRTFEAPILVSDLSVAYAAGDPATNTLFANMSAIMGVYALALVPMHVEAQCLGVLLVTYNTPHQFTPLQGQLYRVLADLAGVALERMRLVQAAHTRLERERWLRDFGERVMRLPDLKSLMTESTQLLQQVVQADGVVVSLVASDDVPNDNVGVIA